MISVCIASFNGASYIKKQLSSILSQLSLNDEVIISDDGSTDDTIAIINSFNDNRIKLIYNNGTNGFTGNFENAIKNAIGDIIFLSDQDDVWFSNKVTISLDYLKNSDMVISNAEIVNENLEQIHPSHFDRYKVRSGFWKNLSKTRYIGACIAFRKEVLDRALPLPINHKYCQHDWWLVLIGEAFYNVKLINEPLIKYRRHSFNASTGGKNSTNSFIKKILIRIYTLYNIIKRI
jgi:glycosyltransferase involved in cell wall biosynthesis